MEGAVLGRAATDEGAGCLALLLKLNSASATESHREANAACASAIVEAFCHAPRYLARSWGAMTSAALAQNFRIKSLLTCDFDLSFSNRGRRPASIIMTSPPSIPKLQRDGSSMECPCLAARHMQLTAPTMHLPAASRESPGFLSAWSNGTAKSVTQPFHSQTGCATLSSSRTEAAAKIRG